VTICLLLHLFKIRYRFFWEFRAYTQEVVKLADMVREVVEEMNLHKAAIRFSDKMLCNI